MEYVIIESIQRTLAEFINYKTVNNFSQYVQLNKTEQIIENNFFHYKFITSFTKLVQENLVLD